MLRTKTKKLMAILLSALLAGAYGLSGRQVNAAMTAASGYTAAERTAAQLEIEGSTSPAYGDFTLTSGNEEDVFADMESFDGESVLQIESTDSATTFKTGLFSPEYRSVYDVTFYIPSASAENVSLSTKLYFKTNMESGTDAEATSMTFGNGSLSYSASSTAAIADFADKWITIRQEFTGAKEKITVLDGETELFVSSLADIAPDSDGGTNVRLNTITSAGLSITGAGTIYIKDASFSTRYYKKNLPFEHEFLFGEQYSDRSGATSGDGQIKGNLKYTKGYFSNVGNHSSAAYNYSTDSQRGVVYTLSTVTSKNDMLEYGFFPVDLSEANNTTTAAFGKLISPMPNYTSGYEVFEMDIKISAVLQARDKTNYNRSLYIVSSGELEAGSSVGDLSASSKLIGFENGNQKMSAVDETYPLNEWFKVRMVLNFNSGTYKVQMIKDVEGTSTLFESTDYPLSSTAFETGFNQMALVFPRPFADSTVYIDDVYCYHVTNEQICEASGMSVSISGTPEIGETLTANVENAPAGQLSYQWYKTTSKYAYSAPLTATTSISGATNSTYTLQAGDEECFITVKVSAEGEMGLPGPIVTTPVSADMFVGILPVSDDFEASAYSGAKWTAAGQAHKGSTTVNLNNIDRASAVISDGRSGNGLEMSIAQAEENSEATAYAWTQRRFFWGSLNKGIVSYSTDLEIESGLSTDFIIVGKTESYSYSFVTFNGGDAYVSDSESGISYPENERVHLILILLNRTEQCARLRRTKLLKMKTFQMI